MKKLWLLGLLPLCGFNRIATVHDDTDKIDREFVAVENALQHPTVQVFTSTPNLRALNDHEVAILSSGTWNNLMFRYGNDIFKVNASCFTVTR